MKELFQKIPKSVRGFLLKALIVVVAWQLLYNLVLGPKRIPDIALTNFSCWGTAKLLSVFYDNISTIYITEIPQKDAVILKDGVKAVAIGDPCNALDIFVLYLGFLYCFPGSWKRRLIFTAWGVPVIYLFNIIRSALITWMNIAHQSWAYFSHHYLFTTMMYLLVFYAWMLYVKKWNHEA